MAGGGGTQIRSPPHCTPLSPPTPRPRTASRGQSSFLQEKLPGGSIRCPLSAGHEVARPSPQNRFRITSPLHTHHTQVQREGLAPGPQAVPEESRERVPEAIGAPGGEQGPHLASRGGKRVISRIQSPPILLAAHLRRPVWEGSQTEDTAPAPSQRSEPARGAGNSSFFPGRPLITPGPVSVPRKLVLYLKSKPLSLPHPSPPPRSSGTGYQGLKPN